VAKGVKRSRLDAELVRRGLARSREHASELIAAGKVKVSGTVAGKPATGVGADAPIVVDTSEHEDPGYASRGAHKLLGALEAFPAVQVKGRRTLDAGASTGGFTDVLLRNEAAHVIAVDVGYGQLVWALQTDERVTVMDRTNVRTLTLDAIGDVKSTSFSFSAVTPMLDMATSPFPATSAGSSSPRLTGMNTAITLRFLFFSFFSLASFLLRSSTNRRPAS